MYRLADGGWKEKLWRMELAPYNGNKGAFYISSFEVPVISDRSSYPQFLADITAAIPMSPGPGACTGWD
jgi:hypothetical protein